MRVLILWFACAGLLVGHADAQQKLNRRFWVAPNGFVRIFNMSGSVKVVGWDKDTLFVTGDAYDPPGGEVVVSPGKQGAKISIWGTAETAARPSHITVYVPRASQVWVKTQSAAISVTEFNGGLDLFSVTGDIAVTDRPDELYAETMAGNVTLTVASRSVRVKTASGRVSLRGRVDDASVGTVSGPISVSDAKLVMARIESVEGPMRYEGAFAEAANIEFINHSGDIEFALSSATTGQFSIHTFEGQFEDHFGIISKQWPGKMKGKEIGFLIGGDAGGEISVRSFKGKVVLRRLQ